MSFTQRTPKDSKILTENKNRSAVNESMTSDNTISVIYFLLHPKFIASMSFQLIIFPKRTFIKKKRNTLSCSQFSFRMLCVDSFLATAYFGSLSSLLKALSESIFQKSRSRICTA